MFSLDVGFGVDDMAGKRKEVDKHAKTMMSTQIIRISKEFLDMSSVAATTTA